MSAPVSVSRYQLSTPLLWISASAGSGKTYRLSTRYLELLFAGVPVDTIVATTFTRKAAGEIFDRVLKRLADAIADEGARRELAQAIGATSLEKSQCEAVMARVLRQLHRLRIGTIDSLFAQIARCHSLELGLPLRWTVWEEHELASLRESAIQAVLDENDGSALRTIIHLMAKGDSVRSIYRLMDSAVESGYATFRDSAGGAWEYPRLPPVPEESAEAICDRLRELAEEHPALREKIEEDIARWESDGAEGLLSCGIAKSVFAGRTRYNRRELPEELVATYQKLIAHAAVRIVQLIAWQTEGTYRLLAAYDEQIKKLRGGGLSFDDVTWFVAQHVAEDEQAAAGYAFRMDSRMDHWLLDEFQDTSALQWRVLRALITASPLGEGRSFFCVGDAKQAIYGWRGGSAEIFRSIPEDPRFAGIVEESLTMSWRSSPVVIETVNRVFRDGLRYNRLEEYPAVREWLERFPEHTTHHTEAPGYAAMRVADDKEAVLEAAVAEIVRLRQEAPSQSIGVLVRKNETVAQLRHLLLEADVAASEEGGNPLTDSVAVSWVRAWLKLLDHPIDRMARFQILHSPLGSSPPRRSTAEALDDDTFFDEMASKGRREVVEFGLGRTLEELVRSWGPHVGARDARRLEQLVELAYGYETQIGTTTAPFLRLVETKRIPDPADEPVRVMTIHQAKGLEFDCVVLPELDIDWYRTQHRLVAHRPAPSKPFDRVFRRPNKEARQFLHEEERQDVEQADRDFIGEMFCLLYVALTRARYALYLFVAPQERADHSLTWSGLLRAALADGEPLGPGEMPFELGDAEWWRQLPDEAQPSSTVAVPTDIEPLPLVRPQEASQQSERVAPSQVASSSTLDAAALLRSRSQALDYGTLVHAWLESITWLDEADHADPARWQAIAMRLGYGGNREELDQWQERFQGYLQCEQIARFLRRSTYDEPSPFGLEEKLARRVAEWRVTNERPIHWWRKDGSLVVGSIDRLVLGYDNQGRPIAAHIIDYKTGPIRDETELADRQDHYGPQMRTYAEVIQEIYGLEPSAVATDLVFLDRKEG